MLSPSQFLAGPVTIEHLAALGTFLKLDLIATLFLFPFLHFTAVGASSLAQMLHRPLNQLGPVRIEAEVCVRARLETSEVQLSGWERLEILIYPSPVHQFSMATVVPELDGSWVNDQNILSDAASSVSVIISPTTLCL